MGRMRKLRWAAVLALATAAASGQLSKPNQAGVSMGHLHIYARDIDAEKKIWTEGFGAAPVKLGPNEGVRIPGAVVLFRKGEPAGGSVGSPINHVGVRVPDLGRAVDKCVAAGATLVSRNDKQAMILSPAQVKIELTLDAAMTEPVASHHIHWNTADVDATKAWWVKTLGAIPGKRAQFEAADVPGVNLSFSKAADAVAPTKGRALDHIGFEVRDLEAFCRRLEAAGVKLTVPYRKVPDLGIALAFFIDPWGVNVELTEGLDKL